MFDVSGTTLTRGYQMDNVDMVLQGGATTQ